MKHKTLASISSLFLFTVACGGPDQAADSDLFVALKPSVISTTQIYTTLAKPFLNCRAQAGTSQPVVFELKAGSVLDVVSKTTINANGFVWLKVNPRGDSD
ncbi:MAG: SH3 domain-containing protein, partial [Oligoflexus sp.]